MRFGHWRVVMFAVALVSAMATARVASADGFHKTIPREVLAYDASTGGPYYAPPIPWGHYAKDGKFDQFFPKSCILCGLCKGKGCNSCGGKGCNGIGHGLLGGHGGQGGLGGHGGGLGGHGGDGGGGGACGHGLFNHCGKGGDGCGDPSCGGGHGRGRRIEDCGLCKNKGCGLCKSSGVGDPIFAMASGRSPATVVPTTHQVASMSSSQCSNPGCGMGKGHGGLHGSICDGCTGKGCGKCGGRGLLHGLGGGQSMGDPCDGCSGRGCGKCGGTGLFHGRGKACDSCGGRGCGKCGLFKGCGFCGGKGCGKCGMGGLGSHMKGKLAGLLHHNNGNIKYFVGPGGPVPLTPGYTPYVVTTRSPRDFLAFPPYTPSEP